jgi:hypothetical protein
VFFLVWRWSHRFFRRQSRLVQLVKRHWCTCHPESSPHVNQNVHTFIKGILQHLTKFQKGRKEHGCEMVGLIQLLYFSFETRFNSYLRCSPTRLEQLRSSLFCYFWMWRSSALYGASEQSSWKAWGEKNYAIQNWIKSNLVAIMGKAWTGSWCLALENAIIAMSRIKRTNT